LWGRCAGSAAIHGLRGKKNIHVFILYPQGRVSEIQEKQMTTVEDANVHCIALEVSQPTRGFRRSGGVLILWAMHGRGRSMTPRPS
jgi:hypothetical protein